MNTSRFLLLLLGIASPAVIVPAASDAKPAGAAVAPAAEKPEWAETFGGTALPAVWQAAVAARERIAAAVAAKQFDGISEAAERVHLAAHAIDDQLTLPDPERARRLRAALRQAAKLADDLLEAASHSEPEKTAEAFRRLQSALRLVQLRLPTEITDSAPASTRREAGAGSRAP